MSIISWILFWDDPGSRDRGRGMSGAGDFERERSWLQDPCLLGNRGGARGLQMMMIGDRDFHTRVPQNQLKLLVVIGKKKQ